MNFKRLGTAMIGGNACHIMDCLSTDLQHIVFLQIIGHSQIVRNFTSYIKSKTSQEKLLSCSRYSDNLKLDFIERCGFEFHFTKCISVEQPLSHNQLSATLFANNVVDSSAQEARLFLSSVDDFDCFNIWLENYVLPIPKDLTFRKTLFRFFLEAKLLGFKTSSVGSVKLMMIHQYNRLNDDDKALMRTILENIYRNRDELNKYLKIA